MSIEIYGEPRPQLSLWLTPSPPSIYVVVPTYNEASNLSKLVSSLFNLYIPTLQILVVDDNSPDGTGRIAEELRVAYFGRVHIIHRPVKNGLGQAYLEGFRYALDHGADFVIQMDADLSHSPAYIPEFLRHASEGDVIVGSRYVTGGRLDPTWSVWRNGLSRWANSIYIRMILGIKVKDATGGFKCWSSQALRTVLEQPITSSGFIFQVEMAYLTEKLGFHILEVPIYFEDRQEGQSKMSSAVKLEAVWRTWTLPWRYRDLRSTADPVRFAGSDRRTTGTANQ